MKIMEQKIAREQGGAAGHPVALLGLVFPKVPRTSPATERTRVRTVSGASIFNFVPDCQVSHEDERASFSPLLAPVPLGGPLACCNGVYVTLLEGEGEPQDPGSGSTPAAHRAHFLAVAACHRRGRQPAHRPRAPLPTPPGVQRGPAQQQRAARSTPEQRTAAHQTNRGGAPSLLILKALIAVHASPRSPPHAHTRSPRRPFSLTHAPLVHAHPLSLFPIKLCLGSALRVQPLPATFHSLRFFALTRPASPCAASFFCRPSFILWRGRLAGVRGSPSSRSRCSLLPVRCRHAPHAHAAHDGIYTPFARAQGGQH